MKRIRPTEHQGKPRRSMLIVATAQRFGGTGLGLAITRNRRALLTSPLDKSDREYLKRSLLLLRSGNASELHHLTPADDFGIDETLLSIRPRAINRNRAELNHLLPNLG